MYVVTFYSYKRGVGRTLALVNIAALLAKGGRRVLAVDFDLEAPSLPEFDIFSTSFGKKGIVDYVTEYRSSGSAPDCHNFIVPCEVADQPIWIMSAGCNADYGYTDKLNDIDWNKLYEEQDGYLLFEDLKQQWSQYEGQGFDYVLIDSRTGHTDVGGICTRHLPDAVSVMFLPNASNISGLIPIVESIRDENSLNGAEIALHVIPTNVPDLDDEKDILSKLIKQACNNLNNGRDFPAVIHHYHSLDILETGLFTISRPNSKLAREYEALRLQIISQNFEDREGALFSLSTVPKELDKARVANDTSRREKLHEQTRNILRLHPNAGEIGFVAAQAFDALGDQAYEREALNIAISEGYEVDRARLIRSEKSLATNNDTKASEDDLIAILKSSSATAFELIPALQFLSEISADWEAAIKTVLDRPDEQNKSILSVVSYLMMRAEAVPYCARRLLALSEFEGLSTKARNRTHKYASLCLIASGEFEEALRYIDNSIELDSNKSRIQHLFNRAMAIWAINGEPPKKLIAEFVNSDEMQVPDNFVNTRQCLALSQGALGHKDDALMQLQAAQQLLTPGDITFSCWTYLNSTSEELTEHFAEMEDAIANDQFIIPRFLHGSAVTNGHIH